MSRNPEKNLCNRNQSNHSARKLNAIALACAAFALPGITSTAVAQPAENPSSTSAINLPAQGLQETLNALSRQFGTGIGAETSLLQNKTAPALQGSYSLQQALNTILPSNGLRAVRSGTAWTVVAAPTSSNTNNSLPEVVITAEADTSGTTEGTGSYTTRSTNTATGLNLSLRETPQSVSVVTQQLIKDRHYVSLDQALRDTPGVLVTQDSGDTRWVYAARGWTIGTIQYDGLTSSVQTFSRDVVPDDDLSMYDRVEVVRGATGLLTGAGNPSASVNLIRKRPTLEPQASLSTTVSSWGNLRSTFDGSTTLNEAGTLRGRTVVSGFAGNNQRKSSDSNNGLLYAVLDMDLGTASKISIGYSHQKQDVDGYSWAGLPTKLDGSFYDFDHNTFLGSDWYYLKRQQDTLYVDAEHHFNNGWTLKAAGRGSKASSDYLSGSSYYDGADLFREDYNVEYENKSHSLSISASGPFSAMGRTHELVLGASTGRDHLWTRGGYKFGIPIGDPQTYDYRSIPWEDLGLNGYERAFTVKQHGLYGAARLNLADPLKLILGSRVSWYDNAYFYKASWGVSPGGYKATAELVPYVGLVYDINNTYSAYASFTEIFDPQSAVDVQGKLLDPVEGTNVELGIKGSFADERLNVSAAVFETKRSNIAEQLPSTACSPTVSSCYEGSEEVRTRGIELEASGELRPGWSIQAGYTYSRSRYIAGEDEGQAFNTRSPKHLAKLGTTYRLPGRWQGLTIGSSVRTQNKIYVQDASYRVKQSAYALVDAMARYTFSDQLALQLNINNLFDRNYYQTISGSPHSSNFIGAGRNVMLTFDYRW